MSVCIRDGCTNEERYPWGYCSEACERYERRLAMHTLFDTPKPIKPENVPNRTPQEMQEVINELREKLE